MTTSRGSRGRAHVSKQNDSNDAAVAAVTSPNKLNLVSEHAVAANVGCDVATLRKMTVKGEFDAYETEPTGGVQ